MMMICALTQLSCTSLSVTRYLHI